MPFALDRDLLLLEPNLFRDIQWSAQRLSSGAASIAGSTLTAAGGSGVDFTAAAVEPGMVALVDLVPVEIIARTSSTTLTVSRPRSALDDPPAPPSPVASRPFVIHSFRPQLQIVHDQVLRMLGIDSSDPDPDALDESAILNPRALRLVESLAALHLIFAGASALAGASTDAALADRAELYRRRFNDARRSAAARIDTNADGVADATRYLSIIQLVRS